MAEFVLDVPGGSHGFRDPTPQDFLKASAEAVDGDLDDAVGYAQRGSRGTIRLAPAFAGEEAFDGLEVGGVGGFVTEGSQYALEERTGPLAVEGHLGWHAIVGGGKEPFFRGGQQGVEGQDRLVSASLLAPESMPVIGEKMIEGAREEGAKPASFPCHVAEVALLDERLKEIVQQVLGVVGRVTTAANEGVQGVAIGIRTLV